ncbi:ROK family protein [Dictyobacter kobayashii]|uniref:Serine/threonine protein kinase n=1 Tax=Dictyobacter kobayashii TaxID=2014872 RepID=A0A402ATF8_9CHLR|nr:ROK family protein [Dictyobacter kobayashii]GCE22398.1 serine/threonine protein kinase [Dictyobacter kobayashii]
MIDIDKGAYYPLQLIQSLIELIVRDNMVRAVKPVDRKVMREANQSTLLNLIRLHAPVSRSQLVTLSGLSTGTVVGITADLLKEQFVIEQGTAASSVGRKAGLLDLHPEGAYVIGLSLVEADIIALALLNLSGEVVYSANWHADLRDQNQVVTRISQGVTDFLLTCNVSRSRILGLGCGLPGYVNADTGSSIDNWIHDWHQLDVAQPLSQQLQMPVYTDNIMNCLGCYEKLFGRGKQYQHFLVVTLGRGVGMAMVMNGEVYRGAHGGGGELGHVPCIPGGRQCTCGNRGCLEAYISDNGLLMSYRELFQTESIDTDELTLAQIHDRAQPDDDGRLAGIFMQAGKLLGISLATMVNVFNPECIILTGVNMDSYPLMFEVMHSALRAHIFSSLGEKLSIVIEAVAETRWAQGAGCLVLRQVFGSPFLLADNTH